MGSKKHYWIGLDGEGIGRDPHRYVLLAASDSEGGNTCVERMSGLGTAECLDWILRLPGTAHLCGYYLGYDWTKILVDLDDVSIYRLLRPELRALPKDEGGGFSEVRHEGFGLHYLGGMMRVRGFGRTRTVWDISRYYQAPFVDALEKWDIELPEEIRDMKARRDKFRDEDYPDIKRYCLLECAALAKLATKLEGAHLDIGVKARSWHGPGSTVTAVFNQWGIAEKRGDIPKEVEEVAARAFFGGRFEQRCAGTFAGVYGYDIVSAYPYELYKLPCLVHGRWKRVTRERDILAASVAQACVHYELTDCGDVPWGPLPCRLDNGTIVFPTTGASGWVWREEWCKARPWKGARFLEAWTLSKECDCQPFVRIKELFEERLRLGKDGKGMVLKYVYNSGYGKIAQTIGNPKFASRVWAGMITSGTRAKLLGAMRKANSLDAVQALATDGVYCLERLSLPERPLDPSPLGSWEEKGPCRMTFVRPGIYWARDGSTLRARGVGRKNLKAQRRAVLRAMKDGGSYDTRGEWRDGVAYIGITTIFGGARACIYATPDGEIRRSNRYGDWHEIPARISLSPAPKRTDDWKPPRLSGVESAPYLGPTSVASAVQRILEAIRWANR